MATSPERLYSSISDEVIKQISARKAVISKLDKRTPDDIKYLSSNTGWVRLYSGVNILSPSEIGALRSGKSKVEGSSNLAQNRILVGGATSIQGEVRGGLENISTTGQGLDTVATNKGAYSTDYLRTGIRPMPGITGISVEHKNTYGTLREVDVNILVWTLTEFEEIEQLFLRPGYTAFLEWGHSMYVDNAGKVVTTPPPIYTGFFSNTIKESTILTEIQRRRKVTSYNYEGMLGYIKNFQWKYLPSGGYECTVSIVSTGEILDSLKMNINPRSRDIDAADFSKEADTAKKEVKSPYHYFFEKLKKIKETTFTKSNFAAGEGQSFVGKLTDFTGFYAAGEYDKEGEMIDEERYNYWLPLRTYLEIFNKYITLVDPSSGKQDKNYTKVRFSVEYGNKFLTFPEQFSIDPEVCIKPILHNIPSKLSGKNFGILENVHQAIKDNLKDIDATDIMNIYINSVYMERLLDESFSENYEDSRGATEIIQTLLKSINTALGGINELDLYFDEDTTEYIIVDRNNTPKTTPPELTLTGIGSVFFDVGIESKLSNEVGSQIAIAAQGSSKSYSENVENLLKWNFGTVDRIHKLKQVTEDTSSDNAEAIKEQKAKEWEEWYENVSDYFSDFIGTAAGAGYTDDQKESVKTLHTEYIKAWLSWRTLVAGDPPQAPIPYELNFQLEGISGLKMGTTFTISSNILPARFQKGFGCIVTGLSQELTQGGKWFTTVKAKYFSTEKTQGIKLNLDTIEGIPTTDPPPPPGDTGSGSGTGGGGYNAAGCDVLKTAQAQQNIEHIKNACKVAGITNSKAVNAIIAIAAGESGLIPVEEGHVYGRDRIQSVFKVSNSQADRASKKGITKQEFFSIVYGEYEPKRVGNRNVADGGKYYGRGFIQFTGYELYAKLSTLIKQYFKKDVNLVQNPGLLLKPDISAMATVMFFVNKGVLNQQNNSNVLEIFMKAVGNDAAGGYNKKRGYFACLEGTAGSGGGGFSGGKGGTTRVIDGVTYKNGQMPDNKMKEINNAARYKGAVGSDGGRIRLYVKAADALNNLIAAAEKAGQTVKINSAYRTYADQERVRNENCESGSCKVPTARPGTSNHGFGIAVDFATPGNSRIKEGDGLYKWLTANGATYGFKRIKSETWHWEYQI